MIFDYGFSKEINFKTARAEQSSTQQKPAQSFYSRGVFCVFKDLVEGADDLVKLINSGELVEFRPA